MKKLLSILIIATLVTAATGCNGSKEGAPSDAANQTSDGQVAAGKENAEKEKVSFWYLWGGDEGVIVEDIIQAYNGSQDKYEVEGLSTPDQQKIIVAISGGKGPDVTDGFGNSVTKYAKEEIAMPLDEFIQQDHFDTSVFVDLAMQQQVYDGKVYALPLSINAYALYYNEDILNSMGYQQPPQTLEELKSIALEATKVENGVVTQLGGMFVPETYWIFSWANAGGASYGSIDAKEFTPVNDGLLDSLQYVEDVVKITGSEPLNTFVTSGKSNWGTPQDPFIAGQQLFKVDGPWCYGIVKSNNPELNFNIAPFPGSEKVGSSGYSLLETSNMFIPSTASNPEGAWDFVKYITAGEGSRMYVSKKGDLAPTTKLLDDSEVIKSFAHFDVYFDIIKSNHLVSLPMYENTSDYAKAIAVAHESVVQGKSVQEALDGYNKTIETIQPVE